MNSCLLFFCIFISCITCAYAKNTTLIQCPNPSAISIQKNTDTTHYPGTYLAQGHLNIVSGSAPSDLIVKGGVDEPTIQGFEFSSYNYDEDNDDLDCSYQSKDGGVILYTMQLGDAFKHCFYLKKPGHGV